MHWLIPSGAEHALLGRFYLAIGVHELTHLAMPFQVLLIVRYLGDPALGAVLFVEHLVALVAEIPTGAWADRFGRKASVLWGHAISAFGWFAIPMATLATTESRLVWLCLAFGLLGAGMSLVSGAMESWVVDNLYAQRRRDLVIHFFGRERSLASAGGIVADILAITTIALVDFRWFFIITGLGELVVLAILAREPELDPESAADDEATPDDDSEAEDDALEVDEPVSIARAVRKGFGAIATRPALLALAVLMFWTATTFGTATEGLQAAFSDTFEASAEHAHDRAPTEAKREERGFAGLELGSDVLGVIAPLLAVWLVGRIGARGVLAGAIVVPAAATACLFVSSPTWAVAALFLLATSCQHIFHTVSDDYRHQWLPSSARATASSALNLLESIAGLGSAAWLGWLLGVFSTSAAVAVMGLATLPAVVCLFVRPESKDSSR